MSKDIIILQHIDIETPGYDVLGPEKPKDKKIIIRCDWNPVGPSRVWVKLDIDRLRILIDSPAIRQAREIIELIGMPVCQRHGGVVEDPGSETSV